MTARCPRSQRWLLAIALALLPHGGECGAKDKDIAPATAEIESGGPYCGVYCVYAALDAIGKEGRIEGLIAPEFVGSYSGSSAVELERAAAEYGARAVTVNRLTADMLRVSSHPIILHVRPVVRSTAYSHWMLFLGMEDGKARILDPPRPVELIPLADVLARWDGTGVVISSEPPTTARFTWLARAAFLALAAIAVCAILVARTRARRRPPETPSLRRDLLAAGRIAAISAAIGLVWHLGCPDGFFLNRSAVASVVANFHSTFLPRLTADELSALLRDKGTVLIDARRPQDYRRGHIDEAISVPVSASLAERERMLAGVSKSARIVLYCQSEGCQWAGEVANVLAASGYKNLSLFPGGWREWSKSLDQDKASPQEASQPK